jgi:hypothetical protein
VIRDFGLTDHLNHDGVGGLCAVNFIPSSQEMHIGGDPHVRWPSERLKLH